MGGNKYIDKNLLIPEDGAIVAMGYTRTLAKTKGIVDALNGINPAELEEIARWVRREVYKMGLDGGYEVLQIQAADAAKWEQHNIDGLYDPPSQEISNAYSARLRVWRTYFALRALSFIDDTIRLRMIGDANAVFRPESEPRKVPQLFLDDEGRLIRDIDDKTPLDQLIDIIAFTDNPFFAEEAEKNGAVIDRELFKAMRRSAHARLIAHLISSDKNLIEVGRQFFTAYHYEEILHRSPGALSEGKIGRKAAGMILAYAVLAADMPEFDTEFAMKKNLARVNSREIQKMKKLLASTDEMSMDEKISRRDEIIKAEQFIGEAEMTGKAKLSDLMDGAIEENNSFFIGSDLLRALIANNPSLAYLRVLKYYDEGDEEENVDDKVIKSINEAVFPSHLLRQLRNFFDFLTEKIGGNPFIVRSSSALEDQLGASFAGMYDSVICSGKSFEEFLEAIKQVYVSVFCSKVIKYRRGINLLDFDESMGLLVQQLNGQWRGKYFMPDFSGVGLSHAPQSPGPDPEEGMMTIVMGLGEKVVQSGGKTIWFAKPGYHFGGRRDRYCQNDICTVDAEDGKVKNIQMKDIVAKNGVFGADLVQDVFTDQNDMIIKTKFLDDPSKVYATFDGMVQAQKPILPLIIEYIVKKLEFALGYKVDIEFTVRKEKDGSYKVRVVQCRPQNIAHNLKPAGVPEHIPAERIIFSSVKCLSGGHADNVRYLLYISPDVYSSGHPEELSHAEMNQLRHWIAIINSKMKDKEYAIAAPGRWGDNPDSELGIYAVAGDYANCAAIVEMVGRGHWKDIAPSAGTHDYQLIVEKGINMFAVNQSDPESGTHDDLLESSDNVLSEFLEGYDIPPRLLKWLKLVDAEKIKDYGLSLRGGKNRFHIAMDNTAEKGGAAMYVARKDKDLPIVRSI